MSSRDRAADGAGGVRVWDTIQGPGYLQTCALGPLASWGGRIVHTCHN